jgi:hypothetical protein
MKKKKRSKKLIVNKSLVKQVIMPYCLYAKKDRLVEVTRRGGFRFKKNFKVSYEALCPNGASFFIHNNGVTTLIVRD